MTCAECDALAEQLRQAREELAEWRRQAGPHNHPRVALLHQALRANGRKLQPAPLRAFWALVDSAGTLMHSERLHRIVSPDAFAGVKTLHVAVHCLRKLLELEGFPRGIVQTIQGGYFIKRSDAQLLQAWAFDLMETTR